MYCIPMFFCCIIICNYRQFTFVHGSCTWVVVTFTGAERLSIINILQIFQLYLTYFNQHMWVTDIVISSVTLTDIRKS